MRKIGIFGICLFTLLTVGIAQADTVIERKIHDTRPCKGLEIGVADLSRERRVRVRSAAVTLTDDQFEVSVDGALACQSPTAALVQTHVGADVTLAITGSFADCASASARVTLRNLESPGLIRDLLQRAKPDLEARLSEHATEEVSARCYEFVQTR